jgi:hypothetical protein
VAAGCEVLAGMDSPVAGAKAGNVEHFLHLRRALEAAASGDQASSGSGQSASASQ